MHFFYALLPLVILGVAQPAHSEIAVNQPAKNFSTASIDLHVKDQDERCHHLKPFCRRGATGPTGPQGPTGATGPRGELGFTGATGPAAAVIPIEDSYTVYVGKAGNDVTADGTINNPFLTIPYALTQIAGLPTPATRFVIYVGPGIYSDPFLLPANVIVIGSSTEGTIQTGNVSINAPTDMTWANDLDNRSGFESLSILGEIAFNLTGATRGKVSLFNIRSVEPVIFDGGSVLNECLIQSCVCFGGLAQNGGHLIVSNTTFLGGSPLILNSANIPGDLSNVISSFSGGGTDGGIEINNPFNKQMDISLNGFGVFGSITTTGGFINIKTSSDSLPNTINLTPGASIEYANGIVTRSVDPAVTATGNDQAGAYPIKASFTNVTSCPAGAGVVLPPAVWLIGRDVIVTNVTQTNCNIYPNGSDTIIGSPAPFVLEGESSIAMVAVTSTNWVLY